VQDGVTRPLSTAMSIEKMELVNLIGRLTDLDSTLRVCIQSGCFHIEPYSKIVSGSDLRFTALQESNPYKPLLKQLLSLQLGGYQFRETATDNVSALAAEEIHAYLTDMEQQFSALSTAISEQNTFIAERMQALRLLTHLRGLQVDLSRLFRCSHISIRFGRIPADSYQKLSYYDDKTFLFVPFDSDSEYHWGFYFAPFDAIAEADEIMRSLFFERIWMPDFIEGTPEEAAHALEDCIAAAYDMLAKSSQQREDLLRRESDKLNALFSLLKRQHDTFRLRSYACVRGDHFYLVGFVPAKDAGRFRELFSGLPDVSLLFKPPAAEQGIATPVKLHSNRFARPFSLFVEMYGLPRYNGFNPTNLVAITYTILFGIMFGDLGQGLVLSLFGFLLYKKTKNALCAIIARIGISSAFFGLIFGSVFGFEHALDPLYHAVGLPHKPLEVMDNMMLVLGGAIAIGVLLILISILINIVLNLKKRDYENALFGNNGIAGLVFFSALLAGIVCTVLLDIKILTAPYIIGLLIVPVIIMFLREPLGCLIAGKKFRLENPVDFFASNFFEVFEFMLGYATNTLSFVRIGGFVFSHAGMMSVVMLLAEGAAKGVSPVIIVLGNIFVMGMEGLIVGIQVLRLEFYEIFSRFYDGDGIPFEPVKISYEPVLE